MTVTVRHVPTGLERRAATTRLTVLDADGRPLPDREVTLALPRPPVGVGCIGFDLVPLANGEPPTRHPVHGGATGDLAELAERFLAVFDHTTLPFYWRGFEPERGRPDTERLRTAARWFRERGVTVKGHPLVWHTLTPGWLTELAPDEVEAEVRARVTREVAGLAGDVDVWDVVNEAVILPVFTAEDNALTRLAARRGRLRVLRLAFEAAHAASPRATLHLNDFDLSERYEQVIEECLAAGVPVDGIGLQTHMHQGYLGEERTTAVLDRFARFGLPLHLTETTLVSGDLMPPHVEDLNDWQVPSWPSTSEGEARQAEELVRHHRTVAGHPAVASTTYWGLTDDGAWLGAPAGLLRADGSPKPAYDALHRLVRGEWTLPPTTARTDARGALHVESVGGTWTVAGGPSENVRQHGPTAAPGVGSVDLGHAPGEARVRLVGTPDP